MHANAGCNKDTAPVHVRLGIASLTILPHLVCGMWHGCAETYTVLHNCIRDRSRWIQCLIPGSKHSDRLTLIKDGVACWTDAIRARRSANVGPT